MHADRLGADEQLLADLAVAAALTDQRRAPRARGRSARRAGPVVRGRRRAPAAGCRARPGAARPAAAGRRAAGPSPAAADSSGSASSPRPAARSTAASRAWLRAVSKTWPNVSNACDRLAATAAPARPPRARRRRSPSAAGRARRRAGPPRRRPRGRAGPAAPSSRSPTPARARRPRPPGGRGRRAGPCLRARPRRRADPSSSADIRTCACSDERCHKRGDRGDDVVVHRGRRGGVAGVAEPVDHRAAADRHDALAVPPGAHRLEQVDGSRVTAADQHGQALRGEQRLGRRRAARRRRTSVERDRVVPVALDEGHVRGLLRASIAYGAHGRPRLDARPRRPRRRRPGPPAGRRSRTPGRPGRRGCAARRRRRALARALLATASSVSRLALASPARRSR